MKFQLCDGSKTVYYGQEQLLWLFEFFSYLPLICLTKMDFGLCCMEYLDKTSQIDGIRLYVMA